MIAIRHNQSYQECCKTPGSASGYGTPFQMIFQTCHMSSQEFHCQGHRWMTWFVWTPENLPWVYPGLLEEPWEPQSWPKSCQVRNEIPKTKTIPQSGRSRIRDKMQFRNDQWIELNPLQRTFASTGWIWGSRRQWTEAENTWHCLLKITKHQDYSSAWWSFLALTSGHHGSLDGELHWCPSRGAIVIQVFLTHSWRDLLMHFFFWCWIPGKVTICYKSQAWGASDKKDSWIHSFFLRFFSLVSKIHQSFLLSGSIHWFIGHSWCQPLLKLQRHIEGCIHTFWGEA